MIRGYIIKFISPLLCFSGAVLLSGCCHYFDIPKEEYLRSNDHSEAKLILDTDQEIIIDDEEDVRVSPTYDSLFVTADTMNYSFPINNIVSIKQNQIDWIATGTISLVILVVAFNLFLYLASPWGD